MERFHGVFADAKVAPRLFFAPGRINLMGAHLDYSGGPVMPMAIDRGTYLAIATRADGRLRLASLCEPEMFEGSIHELPVRALGRWYDYPLGVLTRLLSERSAGAGLDVLFGGDLPVGAGLSSSASICVATSFAVSACLEFPSSTETHIEAALYGEREFVGVQCGIMDPYAVAMARPGHLLWLDCKDRSTELLPIDTQAVHIAVVDTGIRRELAATEFNRRVAECQSAFEKLAQEVPEATCLRDIPRAAVEAGRARLTPEEYRRAVHVAEEVTRTFRARVALIDGDLAAFGREVLTAHASLRDLYEVSIPELDTLVAVSEEWNGFLGGRLTGAGFGGCVVLLVRSEAVAGFEAHLREAYARRFGRRPRVHFFQGDAGPRELTRSG